MNFEVNHLRLKIALSWLMSQDNSAEKRHEAHLEKKAVQHGKDVLAHVPSAVFCEVGCDANIKLQWVRCESHS